MPRTVTSASSARSTAIGWGLAVISVGLLAAVWGCRPSFQTLPPSLVIPAMTSANAREKDFLEFQLNAEDRSADFLILVGSLGEAGDFDSIMVEPLTGRTVGTHHFVLNQSNADQWEADGSRRVTRKLAVPAGDLLVTPVSDSIPVQFFTSDDRPQRIFFLQLGANPGLESSYQPVATRLAVESSRLRIWQDAEMESPSTPTDLTWLVRCLEVDVLPKMAELFGEISDLDGDGKLSICLTPRLSELPPAGTPVEGMVQFNDFLSDLRRPFSNQADVVFLSPHLRAGAHAQAILAHETAHMAVFSRRREIDPSGLELEDDWLNEGLAHFAEVACGGDWSNLQTRIAAFSQNPAMSPLVVTDSQRQDLWRHPGSRGAAWAFLSWLADEYGPDILTELASGPGIGCEKIERIVQQPFEDLFRRWTIALWQTAAASESQFHEGLRTAGPCAANDISSDRSPREISLRGSSHAACRLTLEPEKTSTVRITGPRRSRWQVTVLDRESDPPRIWIVK